MLRSEDEHARRQGIGFSPEIETRLRSRPCPRPSGVARGLASRLRLKHVGIPVGAVRRICRQGIGFSPEIETLFLYTSQMLAITSPGDWLLA